MDYLVGVRTPENTWPRYSPGKECNPPGGIYFNEMREHSPRFPSICSRHVVDICLAAAAQRLARGFAKYLLQPIAKLTAHGGRL